MASSKVWTDPSSEELAYELVETITWCPRSSENFTTLVQYVLSNFRYHQFLDVDSKKVERTVHGICQKLKIHSQSEKAESLQSLCETFLNSVLSSASRETKTDTHYSLLWLLFALSDSPTHSDYTPQSKEQEQEEEGEFDWVGYLLEGEEEEVLGLPSQHNQPGWSDDEDEEQEQSTDSGISVHESQSSSSEDPQRLKLVGNETVSTELASGKKDTNWLSDHVVTQYWCQETPLHDSPTQISCKGHCSLAASWENFQRDQDPFRHPIIMTTLAETQIVRETIWLLFGVKTSYVYTLSSGAIKIRDNIQVLHLTPESLNSLLSEFAKAGEHVVALQNFKSDVFDPQNSLSYTLTIKAFAYALSGFFQKYNEHLCSIEKSIIKQETVVSLLGLQDKLKTALDEVNTLYNLYQSAVLETKKLTNSQKTTYLLNAVYSSLIQADEVGPSAKWKVFQISVSQSHFSQISQLAGVCLLLQIFLETIRPCLDFVNEWVMSGEVQDPFNEFFIQRISEVSVDSASFWSEGVILRSSSHPAEVPLFLQNLVEKIVRAGKSTELIRGLGKIDRLESLITKGMVSSHLGKIACKLNLRQQKDLFETIAKPLYEDFLDKLLKSLSITMSEKMQNYAEERSILEEITDFQQVCSTIEDSGDHVLKLSFMNLFPVEPSAIRSSERYVVEKLNRICLGDWDILKPVKLVIANCLTPLVEERCAQANCSLINLMKSEYNILDHLAALKNFFLLEAGDVMHQLYIQIFVKARRGEVWQDSYSLNCLMEEALQPRFPQCVWRLVLTLTECPNTGGKRSIQTLNGLALHYKAPWPVNIVIDSSSQKLYNHVFLFLMKLKQCKWSLDELRFSDLTGNRRSLHQKQVSSDYQEVENVAAELTPAAGSEPELMQKMFLFRFQLMHFVNSIHYYFMTRVLHTTGVEFQEAIDQVESVDDLITAHSSYVEKLRDRCLLSEKAGSLREVVLKVFNLVLQFQTQWDNGVQHCSHENFKTITETFLKCNTFLVSCLKTISKRGAFPHLESLAFALS